MKFHFISLFVVVREVSLVDVVSCIFVYSWRAYSMDEYRKWFPDSPNRSVRLKSLCFAPSR